MAEHGTHVTKEQILEALKKEGVTDIDTLSTHAEKIGRAKGAGTKASPISTAGWFVVCNAERHAE